MAEIKIIKGGISPVQGVVPQTSSLAIPIGLATKQADALTKALKEAANIYNEQAIDEDKSRAYEIIPEVQKIISKSLNKNATTTNTDLGVKQYQEETKFENFSDLLKNDNGRVQKTIKTWIEKNQPTNIATLVNKINTNHINNTKNKTDEFLTDLVMKKNDPDTNVKLKAEIDYKAFWENPINKNYYDDKEWADLKKAKDKLNDSMALRFQTRYNFREVLANGKAITEKYGSKEAEKIFNKALNSLASDVTKRQKYDEYQEQSDLKQQRVNFLDILARVKQSKDMGANKETLDELPSLDNLYDIYISGGINSYQYEALVNVVTGKEEISDEFVYNSINASLVYGEQIFEADALANFVHTSPKVLQKLNVKDVETFTTLADKFKDNRPLYRKYKTYSTYLKDQVDVAQNFLSSMYSDGDKRKRVSTKTALEAYNDFVAGGMDPQEAYVKALDQALDSETMPKLNVMPQMKSYSLDQVPKTNKETFFVEAEKEISRLYKEGKIDSSTLLKDIEKLDNMKDVFQLWKKMGSPDAAWGGANANIPDDVLKKIKKEK